MGRLGFAGELAGEIRIALPESIGVAIGQAGVAVLGSAVAGGAAMRKRISEGVADGIFEVGAAREVAALVGGVTPRAVGIPVPGGDGEFGVLAVSDRSPSGREALLHHGLGVNFVDEVAVENVHGAAERLVGIEKYGLG